MPGTRHSTPASPAPGAAAHRDARRTTRHGRPVRTAAALAGTVLLLAACSSTPPRPRASALPELVTLRIGTFGTFGYREAGLFAEYMAAHPEIVINEEATQDGKTYWNDLSGKLRDGGTVADIQAVEVGYIAEATGPLADRFTDLRSAAGADPAAWLPWKSAQATTSSGAMIGLGTDIGPMAVCYRKDLFHKAGLPTDREAVGRLWAGDWSRFLDVGRRYKANAPARTAFTDSAGGLFNAVLSGETQQFSAADGTLDYQQSPGVKKAWDIASTAARSGLTDGLQQFTPDWDDALYLNGFATVICPSWMTGVISQYAGDRGEGLWDIAQAPVAGNWGGAFLTVPKSARHPKEAAALAAWLTAPEQQAKVFAKTGNLPSADAALRMPAVQGATNAYFAGAPTGRIYAEAARTIRPAPIGRLDGTVKTVITDTALLDVERNGTDPRKAWNAAVKQISELTGG